METRTSLTKGGLLTFVTQSALFLFGLIASIILARALGPVGRGAYALAILIASVLTKVGSLGLEAANVYYGASRKEQLHDLISNSITVALALGLSLTILSGAAFTLPWPRSYLQANAIPLPLLWLALVTVPMLLASGYLNSLLLSQERIVEYNATGIASIALRLALLLVLLIGLHRGLAGALWAYVLATLGGMLLIAYFINRMAPLRMAFNRRLFRETLGYGIKAHVGNLAQFLNYRLDMFLIGYFLGPAAVGFYAVAVGMAERLWMIPGALATVLFPRVSAGDEGQANALTPKVARHTIFITLILATGLAILAKPLIVLLFGASFEPAVVPLLLLLPGVVALSLSKILTSDLAGRGRPEFGAIAAWASLAVTVSLDLFLIPRWGIAGAALASTLAYSLATIIVVLAFLKLSRNSWIDLLIKASDFEAYPDMLSRVMEWTRYQLFRASKG